MADLSTYIVGPEGEVPLEAQLRGPACRGLTNIGIYLGSALAPSATPTLTRVDGRAIAARRLERLAHPFGVGVRRSGLRRQ